jgi:hypothetical protein
VHLKKVILVLLSIIGLQVGCTVDSVPGEDWPDCDFRYVNHDFVVEQTGLATGEWAEPALTHDPIPVDPKYTHQLGFLFDPMMPPWMKSKPSSGPLILYGDDFSTMVISPMNNFGSSWMLFEDGQVQYGMHGDTERIPAGTQQRFIVVEGQGINHTIQCWGELLRRDRKTEPPDRYADTGLSYVGYWTDNGAAYYYQTAEGMNEEDTLLAVKAEADTIGINYGYFQLDSWWYKKASEQALLSGGLLRWEPYEDMFPQGLAAFRDKLGLPLVAHNRWFDRENGYLNDYEFVTDDAEAAMALPIGPGVYQHFMQSCIDWGIETYEQDWLVNQYWGSRWLRNEPGHLETWLANIHDSAADRGLTTQLCMTGAAHLMDAIDHPNVTTVRTSIDYQANFCKEGFWPQFHTVNMIARAIGVWPFKDNFHSSETFGQAEALISSLSAGMVGIGDALGKTDVPIVMGTCREDGLLLKPDRPATPIDPMFLTHERPFTVTTESVRKGLGEWIYLAAFHIAENHPDRTDNDKLWAILLYDGLDLNDMFVYPDTVTDWAFDMRRDIGRSGTMVAYNWKTREASVVTDAFDIPAAPNHNEFSYIVLAPIFENGLALIGEPDKYVTVADKRFESIKPQKNGIDVTLTGAPGESVTVLVYDTVVGRMLPEGQAVIDAQGRAELSISRELD